LRSRRRHRVAIMSPELRPRSGGDLVAVRELAGGGFPGSRRGRGLCLVLGVGVLRRRPVGAAASFRGDDGLPQRADGLEQGLRLVAGGPCVLLRRRRMKAMVPRPGGHGEDLRPTSHRVLGLAVRGEMLNRLTKHLVRWCFSGRGCSGLQPLLLPAVLRRRRWRPEVVVGVSVRRDLQGLMCYFCFLRVLCAKSPRHLSFWGFLVLCYVCCTSPV
jgi:hypothetical protein